MEVSRVRINGIKNPVGYAFETIRLSWLVSNTEARRAEKVRILVAEDKALQNIIFQKEGENLNSACELLNMVPKPETRYYVQVQVWGNNKEYAQNETLAYFETAKMDQPWKAQWIKPQEMDEFHPIFIKEFICRKAVTYARLYISGLGLYAAKINEEKIGGEMLTPYYSDYKTEVQYQTYDLTEKIQKQNRLSIELGNGWYKGHFGLGGRDKNFGSEFMMIAELHLLYEDGSKEVIGTDETWKYQGSDTESSDIYDGEIINHLLWKDKENPLKAPVKARQDAKLVERYSLPVIEHETMPVREVIHTPAGETVLDFGQNFAGYVQFYARLKKGTKIILDFGEILQNGNFYNANYRRAKSQFVYVSDGREEMVKPQFTYFGFRYVRVTGWNGKIQLGDFTGKALYSDMEVTGQIETGHKKVNQLFSNVMWGQKSNFVDFPTDCPQRDERMGWTGDAQVFAATASYNMDTAAFYHKFCHDLRVEQKKLDGILPGVIPVFDPDGAAFAAVWGDIATFLPTVLYEHYGDINALETDYPMMKDWVDKITKEDMARGTQRYLFDYGNQMGDWLALDGRTEQSMKGGTDDYFIGSCYYAMSVKKTADAAKILGKEADAVYYTELHEKICQAVIREYFTESGRLSIDTQTGYIVSLYSGIYKDRNRVIADFKERLYKDCYKLKGGFVGAPIMCKVMADNLLHEEAFYFLLQEGYPGWMHCINLGATTVWERWNSVLDDGTMSGTMMNSLNHYAFGAIVEYLYKNIAGIRALEPGFKKVQISPIINQKLHYLKASYQSAYGTYRVEWKLKKDGRVHAKIEIPFGCTALVGLPFYPGDAVGELETGVYEFEYKPTEDLRTRYTRKTLFGDMMKDEKAMEIIDRVAPLLQHFLSSGDEEFLHESLATLHGLSFMGFSQELIEQLTKELTAICEDEDD